MRHGPGLEAVPGEPAFAQARGHVESPRREPGPLRIGHGADDVAPAAEIVGALTALAGGKEMRQRIQGRERRLEPRCRAPDEAEAHEGIHLALPIAQSASFGADGTQQRVGLAVITLSQRDPVQAESSLDGPPIRRGAAPEHSPKEGSRGRKIVGELRQSSETECRRAVARIPRERGGPACLDGLQAVVAHRPVGGVNDDPRPRRRALGCRGRAEGREKGPQENVEAHQGGATSLPRGSPRPRQSHCPRRGRAPWPAGWPG